MSDDFDPSPRATKRRKTTRNSGQRASLEGSRDEHGTGKDSINGAEEDAVDSDTIEVSAPASPQKTRTRAVIGHTKTVADVPSTKKQISSPAEVLETSGSSTRKSRTVHKATNNEEIDAQEPSETGTPQPTRSSGRSRRPPKRLVEALDENTPTKPTKAPKATKDKRTSRTVDPIPSRTASPVPRGILTPSGKQKSKAPKSVAFSHEDKEIEEQFGFRDINTPASKKLPQKSTPYPSRSSVTKPQNAERASVPGSEPPETSLSIEDDILVEDLVATVPVPEFNAQAFTTQTVGEDLRLSRLKSRVLSRMTGSSLPGAPPTHLESQYSQLHSWMKSTVVSSESNSLLLLGPRGAGKSMLLDIAVRNLEEDYSSDFHVVKLNGFLQTDDRLALREVWRQLGHSRGLDEAETEDIGASYADTMASLLSLLSHADEMAIDEGDEAAIDSMAGQRTSKSIVFVLDEFDLFTTHPRQTLLYNLFDIAQSRKAPIIVIGCSSRTDVIECLEKRVKSRFSHRWLLVPGCKTLSEWEDEVKNALKINVSETESSKLPNEDLVENETWNKSIETSFLPQQDIQKLIRSEFYTTKSLPQLFTVLHPHVASLQLDFLTEKGKENQQVQALSHVVISPSVLMILKGMPVLHISLLISMCRLEAIHTLSTVNFNLVYTHYTELINTSRLKQTAHGSVTHSGTLREWNRELCREAWEELGIEGLIVPVVGGRDEDGNSGGAEMEETRMWRSEVGLEEILWSVREKFDMRNQGGGGVGEVLVKWCKEA